MSINKVCFTLIVSFSLFVGCSKGPSKGLLSGKVTLNGVPIKNGTIRFMPIDGKTTTTGGKITSGEYSVQAPVNKFKVSINAADDNPQAKPPRSSISDDEPLAKELIPLKYNVRTELTVDIKEGANNQDFVLTSR
jgi:hypothetical protein